MMHRNVIQRMVDGICCVCGCRMLYRAPANNMMPNAGSGIQPTGEIMTTGRRDELVQELVVLCRKIGEEHQQDRKEEVGSGVE
jgi:hypothetical protein